VSALGAFTARMVETLLGGIGDGDPFRWTLALLPLVVLALAWIARACRRRGGRRLPPRLVLGEAVALVLLVTVILGHRSLGIADAAPALAAALFALLGVHVLAQVVALRPLLGAGGGDPAAQDRRAAHGRPSVLFFVLPLVVYCAVLPWSAENRQPDGDEPYYLLLAHSIAYDFDVDLANNYAAADWRRFMDREIAPQPGDQRGPEGQIYSRHNAFFPAVLALPYRLGGRVGVLVALSAIAAALAWVGLRLALRTVPGRQSGALLAYGVLAFAPPLLLYSHQVWVEVPAALAVAVAFERLLAARSGRVTASDPAYWLPFAASVAVLPFLKMRFALIAGPLVLLAWWRTGRSRRVVAVLAGSLVVALGAVLVINQVRFGNPLKIHAWQELDLAAFSPASYAEGFFGLFWDAAFGLFFFAPIWLLVIPAAALAVRTERPDRVPGPGSDRAPAGSARWSADDEHRRCAVLAGEIALLSLPYLALTAPRTEWYGGWSPPFRYGVVLLPLLVAVLAPVLATRRRPGARALLAALGLATAVLTLVWMAIPGWTYDFADGRTRLLDALSDSLSADVARFFPSYVRPRLASWLWPPLSALAVGLLWWRPRRRRRLPGLVAGPTLGAPAVAGAALLLLALAALPWTGRHLATHVVEFEDPWVIHDGGHLQPEPWTVARSSYRSGWVIRPFEEVRVPVVPGGGALELAIELELGRNNPDPLTLEVAAGDRVLARWTGEEGEEVPSRLELGPFDWPAAGVAAPSPDRTPRELGDRDGDTANLLVLRAVGPGRAGRQNGFLLDRMEIRWR